MVLYLVLLFLCWVFFIFFHLFQVYWNVCSCSFFINAYLKPLSIILTSLSSCGVDIYWLSFFIIFEIFLNLGMTLIFDWSLDISVSYFQTWIETWLFLYNVLRLGSHLSSMFYQVFSDSALAEAEWVSSCYFQVELEIQVPYLPSVDSWGSTFMISGWGSGISTSPHGLHQILW